MPKGKWETINRGGKELETSDQTRARTKQFLSEFATEFKSSELHRAPSLEELLLSLEMVLAADFERYCSDAAGKELVELTAKTK